ncbi:MAG: hypothetical protein DRJ64_09160 [Thermoprotei archaeon]|nr:MAG: hypothetical protein DRJ64_09160 [Thermoprotei archaeon]
MTALFLSVMLFVISSVTAFLLKGCFAEWEWRMELKGILSIFQILLAMFLPIILMGVKIQGTQLEVEAGKTLVSLTAMMLIALSGCLYRMQKEEGRI